MQSKVTHFGNLLQTCIDKKAHLIGKCLQAQIIVNGLFSDIFLSNRLIEFYYKCGDIGSARHVFDTMPGRNVYTWNAIVTAFCKARNLQDALQLFMAMPERNGVSWNTVISSLVRNGLESQALDYYCMMHREGFGPSHFTFSSVLSACGSLMDIGHGRRCHSTVIKVGLDHNKYVENALVGMYAKCGIINDAIQVFGEMCHPNEVSFTALMGGLAQTDHVDEALRMFTKMHKIGIRIDPVSLSGVLSVCARGESEHGVQCYVHGLQVHCLSIKLGFELDLHVGNSLIDMYAKNENMETAEMLFASFPEVNNVSWNILIAGYGQMGRSDKAVELLGRMQRDGFEPDEVTYISMLGACVKSGDMVTGRQMFERMSIPKVSSWNALLTGYSQKGNHKEALEFFRKMQFLSVQPDRTTLAIVLSSCAGMGFLEGGKQVHAVLTKASFQADIFVASGLIDMYSKCESIDLARCFFDRMPERDIVCWNSMISGFALHSLHREAFTLFQQLQEKGMRPSQFSYASVLSSCARLASVSQGRQIHAQIAKDGHMHDVYVGSALIDLYSRCGDVDDARQFFNEMTNKNTVSWNEMIHGYAQNGCGEESVDLFQDMILSGEKPDSITFIAVLTACSHSGLVDEGLKIFNSMEQDHGVEPLAEHYTCIIDSLGRAARFGEAEVILNKMPCKDDPIVWEVLLSSCRVHANVNLGKQAAEQLFRLDPQNPAPYVLLSNIYAALGRWDDASAVRGMMGGRDVVKYPGYSWIEFKNEVQAFMVDDDLSKVDDGNPLSLGMIQTVSRGGTCST
ncbi:pentatricopeptide repeat-containing protein At4g20770 [Macadamia integrifolia]|uniref:pentatricopeptide repeat-containing protein At4g20770 n=1 Tax=Macadamia integrifolia TaxID=60698 RepID=UPI001C52C7FB|nr:pentatricopeptide repeat-containing protein At4g20770 [Macadamia integrifolia]